MEIDGKNPPSDLGHEERDANIRSLLQFAGWLFVSLVLVALLMRWMFWHFNKTQELGPPPTPFESTRALPPTPRLQTAPQQDLSSYRAGQQENLKSFGWVDQKNGVVRIPIDRAMDLLLQQGLPVRGSSQARAPRPAGKTAGVGKSPSAPGEIEKKN
ncbi:MAG TPA: hypothetical protein VGQ11_00060 [Candidatus Acidoferrales bacterium]|jgi:hypothetical protein|nr:hypothetical protein [Candidatus Acidoferrales bacterium]